MPQPAFQVPDQPHMANLPEAELTIRDLEEQRNTMRMSDSLAATQAEHKSSGGCLLCWSGNEVGTSIFPTSTRVESIS
jgi:hypothetical protein